MNVEFPSNRLLLSGASGMLGAALRQALSALGSQVLQLVRRTPAGSDQLHWNPAAEPVLPNPEALEDLAAAIHLSGANVAGHRWTDSYKREMTVSRVQSTRALATMLAGLRHPPKTLLVASAIGIYGNRGDDILDETSLPGRGFFGELCKEWEAAAQPARHAGIRVVHLRFGVVLGPGQGALGRMLPLFRMGLGGPLGSGQQYMSWIAQEDVVGAILFLLETPALSGPVNLTAPRPVTNAEFTRVLAHQLHRPAVLPVPAFALKLALGQMADEALLASARVYPAKLTIAGFRFRYPSLEQALTAALAGPALS